MRAYMVDFARFWIYQLPQTGSLGTLPYNLPSAMAVYAEEKKLAITNHRATTLDIVFKDFHGFGIYGQVTTTGLLSAFFKRFCDFTAAAGAVIMGATEPGAAVRTEEFESLFQMSDANRAGDKVYVTNGDGKGLGYATA